MLSEIIKLKDAELLSLEISVSHFADPTLIWFFCGEIIHKVGTESEGFNSLSTQGVATKYKDFTSDHAMALLSMREDIGRGNVNEVSQCFVCIT